MNVVILMGRLTKDPEIRYTQDNKPVASYTLAVNRGKDSADFISCEAWESRAQFAEKYLHKGTKILARGSIVTGSYEKNGQKVYTTKVRIAEQEFAESKNSSASPQENGYLPPDDDFMKIPDGIDEELPFN